jgi:UDP-N-acetylglucosamine 2-epimerase
MMTSVTKDLIQQVVKNLLTNQNLRQEMSIKGRKLVDGKGTGRIVKEILIAAAGRGIAEHDS